VTKPISKHQKHRRSVKAKAIALLGGCCSRCGFADARALRMHHVKPVRRGRNGLAQAGDVIDGKPSRCPARRPQRRDDIPLAPFALDTSKTFGAFCI
jgi:hypothetical protein